MKSLRSLNIAGTNVTDACVAAIASMKRLDDVYIWDTAVTAEGIEWLGHARPDLSIVPEQVGRQTLKSHWSRYFERRVELQLRQKRPVVIVFTSGWDPTSRSHERLVDTSVDIKKTMARIGALAILVDLTQLRDRDEGWALMRRFGCESVPATVFLTPNAEPRVLRGGTTEPAYLEMMDNAAAPINDHGCSLRNHGPVHKCHAGVVRRRPAFSYSVTNFRFKWLAPAE